MPHPGVKEEVIWATSASVVQITSFVLRGAAGARQF